MDRDWDLGGVADGVVEAVADLFVGEVDVVALLDVEAAGEVEEDSREGDPRMLGAETVCPSRIGPSLSPMVRPRESATVAPALRALIRSVRPTHRLRWVVIAAGASVQTVPQDLHTWMRRGGKSVMRKGKPGWVFLIWGTKSPWASGHRGHLTGKVRGSGAEGRGVEGCRVAGGGEAEVE